MTDVGLGNGDAYRPWPPPAGTWVLGMRWTGLLFMHWPVPADVLRAQIPAGLVLETFEGQAWLGVVPFRMSRTRLRGVPRGLPAFPELNVRTYVTRDGKPGVWFFSLDAASRAAVWGARLGASLPYFHADITHERRDGWIDYRSRRIQRGAHSTRFHARYKPIGPAFVAERGSLAHFLTARYCLYSSSRSGRIYRLEIDHDPWPLRTAECEIVENTMADPIGVALPSIAPVLHYAETLDVRAWWPQRLSNFGSTLD